jgi:hypothetical protein
MHTRQNAQIHTEKTMRLTFGLALLLAIASLSGCTSTPNTWSTVSVDIYLAEDEEGVDLIRLEDPDSRRKRNQIRRDALRRGKRITSRLPLRKYLYRHPNPVITVRDIEEASTIDVQINSIGDFTTWSEADKLLKDDSKDISASDGKRVPGLSVRFTRSGRSRLASAMSKHTREINLPRTLGDPSKTQKIRPVLVLNISNRLLAVTTVRGDIERSMVFIGQFSTEQVKALAAAINGKGQPPADLGKYTYESKHRGAQRTPRGPTIEW